MTPEAHARSVARAVAVEYRLSPERYEAIGGEHPIIDVIARHVAQAIRQAENEVIEKAVAQLKTLEKPEGHYTTFGATCAHQDALEEAEDAIRSLATKDP